MFYNTPTNPDYWYKSTYFRVPEPIYRINKVHVCPYSRG